LIHIVQSGSGLPIILLHGFCENHHLWDQLSAKLSSRYKVLALDLPGFGRSTPLPESCASIDDITGSIAEEIARRDIGPPVIIGHSLGGYVALALADLYPQLIRGVALVNSTTFSDNSAKIRTRNKVIEFISKHGAQKFTNQFVEDIFYRRDKYKKEMEIVRTMGLSCTKETLIQYTGLMRDRPDRTYLLTQSRLPTMVIAGSDDHLIPLSQSQEMIDFLPKGNGFLLNACGHMAMYEQPAELYQHLSGFVNHFTDQNS
jgi:pimeloyl-ACP methyl ester carboxylesterase